jgi:hypothetical protein
MSASWTVTDQDRGDGATNSEIATAIQSATFISRSGRWWH